MRIKLIGGPCDGQWATVQGEMKDGREITVVRPNPRSSVWTGEYFNRDLPPIGNQDWETHQYVIGSITSPNQGGVEVTWYAHRADMALYEVMRRLVHYYEGKPSG